MTTSEIYDILHAQQDAEEEEEQYWQNRGNQYIDYSGTRNEINEI